mmetsp:Transcript_139262/g.445157  ORF Transcript_139262/g.445157 Transcript_139262/m.445157 type:complete len:116 (+) Transcript_139262:32-379(+)
MVAETDPRRWRLRSSPTSKPGCPTAWQLLKIAVRAQERRRFCRNQRLQPHNRGVTPDLRRRWTAVSATVDEFMARLQQMESISTQHDQAIQQHNINVQAAQIAAAASVQQAPQQC